MTTRTAKSCAFCRLFLLILALGLGFSSCQRRLGYGVLLWTAEDAGIPSGTVLPVYIRSNIDKVWVVGIPKAYRTDVENEMAEIPLAMLDLAGGRAAAEKQAAEFAPYAATYAETIQDGLPVRDNPDNSARRVYRLRAGEIITILGTAEGNPAISASGTPLPGEWYRVLTEDGSQGYCFSYRLNLFEHSGGPLSTAVSRAAEEREQERDIELENLLSKTWVAETYFTMVNQGRLNIDDLAKNWGFSPGEDVGIAHISLPDNDQGFSYSAIRPAGVRSWAFEGAPLSMRLRSDTTLAVQWNDAAGYEHTALFVNLPVTLADLIVQESGRREALYAEIFTRGPAYSSANYGTIAFTESGEFIWTGFQRLVPQVIPASVTGAGTVDMRLFITTALENRYSGAFTLSFNTIGGAGPQVNFMYLFDPDEGSLRLEYAPPANLDGVTVLRRAGSPIIIYFYNEN
jgi:hypothetical protein